MENSSIKTRSAKFGVFMHIIMFSAFVSSSVIAAKIKETSLRTLTLRMPNIKPDIPDSYICRGIKVDPNREYYITAYEPLAKAEIAHHMTLMGCMEPGSTEEFWHCRTYEDETIQYSRPCKNDSKYELLHLWGNDAGKFELPKDTGFVIGGRSKTQYLVLQVHYISVDRFKEEGVTDNTGLAITYSRDPTPKLAAIMRQSSLGRILPNSTEYFETACKVKNEEEIHAFAFRVHTHSLGRVVAGYKVEMKKPVEEWTLLGKKDPRLPQFFYPIENEVTLRKGDYLASRCTFVNDRNKTVRVGNTADDEMCMFYIMYWMNSYNDNATYCRDSLGPPYLSWLTYGFLTSPEDASTLSPEDTLYEGMAGHDFSMLMGS